MINVVKHIFLVTRVTEEGQGEGGDILYGMYAEQLCERCGEPLLAINPLMNVSQEEIQEGIVNYQCMNKGCPKRGEVVKRKVFYKKLS